MTSWFLRLQIKIFILILVKIRRFHTRRDSLAGIVTIFPAGIAIRHDTVLYAQQLMLREAGRVKTSGTGTGHSLSKQHDVSSRIIL